MKKPTVSREVLDVVEWAGKWVTSLRGRKAMESLLQEFREATLRLQKSRQVDPRTLDRPMTI